MLVNHRNCKWQAHTVHLLADSRVFISRLIRMPNYYQIWLVALCCSFSLYFTKYCIIFSLIGSYQWIFSPHPQDKNRLWTSHFFLWCSPNCHKSLTITWLLQTSPPSDCPAPLIYFFNFEALPNILHYIHTTLTALHMLMHLHDCC